MYLVHDTVDVGFISASYTKLLTEKGREEHKELLRASVKEICKGAYGVEVVLENVDAEYLLNFDAAAAAFKETEFEIDDMIQ